MANTERILAIKMLRMAFNKNCAKIAPKNMDESLSYIAHSNHKKSYVMLASALLIRKWCLGVIFYDPKRIANASETVDHHRFRSAAKWNFSNAKKKKNKSTHNGSTSMSSRSPHRAIYRSGQGPTLTIRTASYTRAKAKHTCHYTYAPKSAEASRRME